MFLDSSVKSYRAAKHNEDYLYNVKAEQILIKNYKKCPPSRFEVRLTALPSPHVLDSIIATGLSHAIRMQLMTYQNAMSCYFSVMIVYPAKRYDHLHLFN